MPEHDMPVERRTSWYRKVALVILLPFVLPTVPLVLAILFGLGLYAVIHNFVSEVLFSLFVESKTKTKLLKKMGKAVADLAAELEFVVWIVDDRQEFVAESRFPKAERRISGR
jgi:hypothetical protein